MTDIARLQEGVIEAERLVARLGQLKALQYTPHPGQLRFHTSTARIRGIYTGNL
jgi:hypothetical protein